MGRAVTTGRTSDAGTCWEASVRHVRRRSYHHEPCRAAVLPELDEPATVDREPARVEVGG